MFFFFLLEYRLKYALQEQNVRGQETTPSMKRKIKQEKEKKKSGCTI